MKTLIDFIIRILIHFTSTEWLAETPSHECVYGPVVEGVQHCTLCGKAITVPCNHKFEIIDIMNYTKRSGWDNSEYPVKVYTLQCHCGHMKKETING
jgi:hypothetical protein